ncbi:hypothetical protein TH63_10820 [Rufibacter radiotolerans]|uniref:Colicin import membrane protein n=1 Tax=Rufibacter radiotolerans TaxID=1379910 RepID=A0A0H4VL00_9BACT|nr:hypothetical protein [Rufibacter radiotolerans]AKQ46018.1 hypothetical protein TH63_10820 [Rufibacter radiotolerans]
MKIRTLLFTLVAGFFCFFALPSFAQVTHNEVEMKLEKASVEEKEKADKQRLEAAKDLKKSTSEEAKVAKENAKAAGRIQDDAENAAKQAKEASRLEAKAQRTRSNADKQAKKAAKAKSSK